MIVKMIKNLESKMEKLQESINKDISLECFLMRLTIESMDWVKQIALPNVGGTYLISWKPHPSEDWHPPP